MMPESIMATSFHTLVRNLIAQKCYQAETETLGRNASCNRRRSRKLSTVQALDSIFFSLPGGRSRSGVDFGGGIKNIKNIKNIKICCKAKKKTSSGLLEGQCHSTQVFQERFC